MERFRWYFSIIYTLVVIAITAIAFIHKTKKREEKSLFLIFGAVDGILTFIGAAAALIAYVAAMCFNDLDLAVLTGMYLGFWLPVAAVLGVIAVVFHFLSKKR